MRKPVTGLLLVLAAAMLTLASAGSPASAGPLPLGPGGVYSLHVQLFRALDAGDGAALEKLLGGRERGLLIGPDGEWDEGGEDLQMFLLGPGGAPVEIDDAQAARKLLLAQDTLEASAGAWSTKILAGWMDCPSADVSFATLVFERTREVDGKEVLRRYRSTSLVSYEDGGWKLWHFHVSPAAAARAR